MFDCETFTPEQYVQVSSANPTQTIGKFILVDLYYCTIDIECLNALRVETLGSYNLLW